MKNFNLLALFVVLGLGMTGCFNNKQQKSEDTVEVEGQELPVAEAAEGEEAVVSEEVK